MAQRGRGCLEVSCCAWCAYNGTLLVALFEEKHPAGLVLVNDPRQGRLLEDEHAHTAYPRYTGGAQHVPGII